MHYLNYIGAFQTGFGYGVHVSNFYEALSAHYPAVKYDAPAGDPSLLYQEISMRSQRVPGVPINLHIASAYEYGFMKQNLQGFNIGFTPIDFDYLYPGYKAVYESIDRIWVPTSWGKQVLVDHGLSSEKIDVIPEGFDPNIFYPTQKDPNKEFFEFITVGKLEDRKGLDILVKAFDKAFEGQDDVRLHLVIANCFDQSLDYEEFLKDCGVKDRSKYILYPQIIEEKELVKLYQSVDAAVFTTRSEGWGLPIVDAMASGLPTIVTHYSAQTEYITDQNAYLLDYTLVPNRSRQFLRFSGLPRDLKYYGNWAEPDFDHLIALLRDVFDNRDKAQKRGAFAAKDMLAKWTWDHAAKKAADVLKRIEKC